MPGKSCKQKVRRTFQATETAQERPRGKREIETMCDESSSVGLVGSGNQGEALTGWVRQGLVSYTRTWRLCVESHREDQRVLSMVTSSDFCFRKMTTG